MTIAGAILIVGLLCFLAIDSWSGFKIARILGAMVLGVCGLGLVALLVMGAIAWATRRSDRAACEARFDLQFTPEYEAAMSSYVAREGRTDTEAIDLLRCYRAHGKRAH